MRSIRLLPTILSAMVLGPLAGAAAALPDATQSSRAAAINGSVAFMASAPTPSRIPRDRCAVVKFNWGVGSSHPNSAFWGSMTVKQGSKTITTHRVERMSPNRWSYVLGKVCTPGTITMTVRGEFFDVSQPWEPVRVDRIADRRSYAIR